MFMGTLTVIFRNVGTHFSLKNGCLFSLIRRCLFRKKNLKNIPRVNKASLQFIVSGALPACKSCQRWAPGEICPHLQTLIKLSRDNCVSFSFVLFPFNGWDNCDRCGMLIRNSNSSAACACPFVALCARVFFLICCVSAVTATFVQVP